MSIVVRPIGPGDDHRRAGAIVRDAYESLADQPDDALYHESLADLSNRLDDTEVIVAVDSDGEVVGCLTFVAGPGTHHYEFDDPDAASFRYFGVDTRRQGEGIGEAMVHWVLDRARALGRRRVLIHTLTNMHGAQRLYQRLGFVREPNEDCDWDGIKGICFRREL
jgi:GNAT superfamily N-acetyltransferase